MATPAIYKLYTKIVLDALSVSKIKLNKCRRDFMIEIFMLYLSIPSWINFLQLGHYSRFGEQRFRRQFEERFDFFGFYKALSMPWIGSRIAVAFDPSFVHKSGKKTLGIGYFWSGRKIPDKRKNNLSPFFFNRHLAIQKQGKIHFLWQYT